MVLRDHTLPDRDWTVLPAGSRAFWFPVPSGNLATFELGDPAAPSPGTRPCSWPI